MEKVICVKPSATLLHMPRHIKQQIINHLPTYFDRMSLRRVNKHFQKLIETVPHEFYGVMIRFEVHKVLLIFSEKSEIVSHYCIKFIKDEFGCKVLSYNWSTKGSKIEKESEIMEELVMGADFVDMAGETILAILGNTNLKVGNFRVCHNFEGFLDNLAEFKKIEKKLLLKTKKAMINAGNFSVFSLSFCYSGNEEDVLCILPHLDVEYLDTFELECTYLHQGPIEISRIMSTEQVKKLDVLKMFDLPGNKLPFEMWKDYPITEMTLNHDKLEDYLTFFKHFFYSPTFESTKIATRFSQKDLMKSLQTYRFPWQSKEQEVYINLWNEVKGQPMRLTISDSCFELKELTDEEGSDEEDEDEEECQLVQHLAFFHN